MQWAPHICCVSCAIRLQVKGFRLYMPFAVPLIWREQKDHLTDCYFCMRKIADYILIPININLVISRSYATKTFEEWDDENDNIADSTDPDFISVDQPHLTSQI